MGAVRRSGLVGGGLALVVAGVLVATSSGGPADAQVVAQAQVSPKITLSGLTPSFTLTGDPETTASQDGVVAFNVKTNNRTGYSVTVQALAPAMVGATVGNTDTIPVGNLSVRETGTLPWLPVSDLGTVTVHSQATRSGGTGDDLTNDVAVDIPFVNADTYSVALEYLATVNP